MEWKDRGSNSTLDAEHFYISFSNKIAESTRGFAEFGTLLGIQTQAIETALCTPEQEPKWRILNGDFRKEYEAAFPDLAACIAVYDKHKAEHRCDWSTD